MGSHVIIKVYVCIVIKLRIDGTVAISALEALYRDKIKFFMAKNIAL